MAVRIADSLKQQNDLDTFPVAYGDGIWLDKNKGEDPANYKSLQAMYNDDELGGGGSSIQVETMPTASAENVGKIVQYVGESGTYQKGHFYECILAHNGGTTYAWEDVDHLRFNHVVYHCTVPPANEEYKPGDIIYYSGKTMGNFKNGYYYRAIPNATPQQYYGATFWMTQSSGTGYICYTPFELRIGFIVYPTGTGGTSYPYEITDFDDTGITITPYGWSGEDHHYVGVSYTQTVEGWEELEGGGGGSSIFYGTMEEWNALSADEKKQYEYMTDEQMGGDDVISIPNPMTRNTIRTSDLQEIGALKQGRIAQIKCYVTFKDIIANTWNTVATVVDSLKPVMETPLTVSEGAVVNKVALFRLSTDGKIQVWGNQIADGDTTRVSATYFTAS